MRLTHRLDELPELIDAEDLAGIRDLFNLVLTQCISEQSKAFADENTCRDIIYALLPSKKLFKSREQVNARGYSDLELKTGKTHLVIEFKRSSARISDAQALKAGLKQIKQRRYGAGIEQLKLVQVCMVINSEQKEITEYYRIED